MVEKLKIDFCDVGGNVDDLKEDVEKDIFVVEVEVEDLVVRIKKLLVFLDDRVIQLIVVEEVLYEYYVIVQKVEDVFSEVFDVVDVFVVFSINIEMVCQYFVKIKVWWCCYFFILFIDLCCFLWVVVFCLGRDI